MDARRYFLSGMRLFFGLWLLYVGLNKWILIGPNNFVGFITNDFDKTWSPHVLNVALAWLIIVTEPLGALFILSGIKPRLAWSLNSALMFLLVIGQTILMKPATDNWYYVIVTLACAALSNKEQNT